MKIEYSLNLNHSKFVCFVDFFKVCVKTIKYKKVRYNLHCYAGQNRALGVKLTLIVILGLKYSPRETDDLSHSIKKYLHKFIYLLK